MKEILTQWNTLFTVSVLFPVICLFGLYLSIKLRWIQLRKLQLSLQELLRKEAKSEGSISHYQALASVLAGNFGTGNISGIAVALSAGGPGALVWMWVMAFFGSIIQFASCVLGVMFRKKNSDGEFVGGPMYYLADGLKAKKLACFFSIATIFAAFTVGNFAQVHSVSLPLAQMGISPLVTGLCMAALSCLVILGGIQSIAKVAASIVPIMAALYLLTTCTILAYHKEMILPSLELMISSAFNCKTAVGGLFGYATMQAITAGFDRGLFATDAGTGIVPILQASARTRNPVIDGIVTLIAPFFVMIVCTATGLVLCVTGAWQVAGLESTNMVTYAFEKGLGGKIGFYVVAISLFLFAYTTCIAWAACGEKAVGFLSNRRRKLFQFFYIVMIPVGAFMHVETLWAMADLSISFMLAANMIGVIALSGQVCSATRSYFIPHNKAYKV